MRVVMVLEKIGEEARGNQTMHLYELRRSAGGEALTGFSMETLDTLLEHPLWQEAIQKIMPDRIECIVDAVGGVHLRLVMRKPRNTEYDRIKLE